MVSMTKLLILLFTVVIKVKHVHSYWDWNNDNVKCLKELFYEYVSGMENIFSPDGQLGRKSYILRMQNMKLREILEMRNFLPIIGDIVRKISDSLNHEIFTTDRDTCSAARNVVLNLCNGIKISCPGAELHHVFVNVIHGKEDEFVDNCGDYDKNPPPRKSHIKIEKTPSKGVISKIGTSFSRRFGSSSHGKSKESDENTYED